MSSKVGEVLSEEKLEADRQKILKIYEDRNYSDVDVQYRIEEIAGTNQVRVIFQITEGPRLVIRRINFFGNDSVRSRDLIKVMKTRPWNLLSFFNKSGRLLPAQMEEDRVAIQDSLSESWLRRCGSHRRSDGPAGGDGSGTEHHNC